MGTLLDPEELKKLLPAGASLFVNFPLPSLPASIELGEGSKNDAVHVQKSPAGPDYTLAGQWDGAEFLYAWVRPGAISEDQNEMNLPVRTDWFSAASPAFASDLCEAALKLNRIKAWMTLSPPPGGDDKSNRFPYRLSLRKVGTSDSLRDRESQTHQGERYKVWLTASAAIKGDIPPRWIYVLAIDRDGDIQVLIPSGEGNTGNQVPLDTPPAELQLTSQPYDFEIGGPYGLDTYILLTSADPIDPRVLSASGVRSRSANHEGANPLANLLSSLGASGRSRDAAKAAPVPITWSIERLTVRSLEHETPQ